MPGCGPLVMQLEALRLSPLVRLHTAGWACQRPGSPVRASPKKVWSTRPNSSEVRVSLVQGQQRVPWALALGHCWAEPLLLPRADQ